MWIHILVFILILAVVIAWKMDWLHLQGMDDPAGKKLFVLAALAGNCLGMMLTITNQTELSQDWDYKLEKKEEISYEEEFMVSVEGRQDYSLRIQIPEKESEESPWTSTEEEDEVTQQKRALLEAIAQYNQEKNDPDYYFLPVEWEGKWLKWSYPADRTGVMFTALGLLAAVVLLMRKAKEEQEAWLKRCDQLLMDYPGLIMKFTLLVQAGMTVRKAFQKISLDYKKKEGKKGRYAYEEIVNACYEMESGISELEAYRRFGERCGQIKYKTFATLLIQNLQKGSRRMSDMLEAESMEAWDERKRKARVLGEAAATKLLGPMMMMLVVVMAIIMIPAFLSFYG